MSFLLALAAFGLVAAGAARADPQNVRQSLSVLQPFQPPTGGASAPSPATAKRNPERDLEFRAYDLDGDGYISRAEAAGHAVVVGGFDRADRNADGKLSYGEYDALMRREAALQKAREAREKARQAKAKK